MIFGRFLFWLAVALLAAQPALACRGIFSQRYILLETLPSRLPPTAVLLEVEVPSDAYTKLGSNGWSVVGRITGAKSKRLMGKPVKIQQEGFTSCDRWAESQKARYVVGFLAKRRGELTILPVTYRSKEFRTEAEDKSEGISAPAHGDVE